MKGTKMETTERLRAEKKDFDQRYYEQGQSEGITDAKEMSYEELLEVIKMEAPQNIY